MQIPAGPLEAKTVHPRRWTSSKLCLSITLTHGSEENSNLHFMDESSVRKKIAAFNNTAHKVQGKPCFWNICPYANLEGHGFGSRLLRERKNVCVVSKGCFSSLFLSRVFALSVLCSLTCQKWYFSYLCFIFIFYLIFVKMWVWKICCLGNKG